jgi:hypothetical protein
MTEDSLDVEQVEVVGTFGRRGSVEDGGGRSAEVVRGDVAEAGGLGTSLHGEPDGVAARAERVSPAELLPAGASGDRAQQRAVGRCAANGVGVHGEVAP